MKIIDILVQQKMVPSKSEARRLIEQGGVKINNEVITSIEEKAKPGILQVGKRKFLRVSNYSRLNMNFSSGGYGSLNICPLNEDFSNSEVPQIISEPLAKLALFMLNKGYAESSISTDSSNLVTHFNQLISKELIPYKIDSNRNIEIDLWINAYLKPIKEVMEYVKKINKISSKILEIRKTENGRKASWLTKLECPNCFEQNLDYSDNQIDMYPNEKWNVNGVCRSCGFIFNELV